MSDDSSYTVHADAGRLTEAVESSSRSLGLLGLVVGFLVGAAVAVGFVSDGPLLPRLPLAGLALLLAGAAVTVCRAHWRIRRTAQQTMGLEIEIGPEGITRTRPGRTAVSWEDVADVVASRQGKFRRLEVSTAHDRDVITAVLDYLDRPPADVIEAVRRYSGGRFPRSATASPS